MREGMKKQKKKKETINMADFFGRGITYAYLILMMGLFPSYYPGHLIGIHTEKTNFFLVVTTVYMCLMILPVLGSCITFVKEKRKWKPEAGGIFVGVFLLAVVVSTWVTALDRSKALYGNSRMKTGAVVLLFCIAAYYAVKKYVSFDKYIIWANLLCSSFIYLSGIFITCKTDILDMQKNIIEEQRGIFVSPLGNINYNVAYISLILPAAMVLFLICRELFTQRVLVAYLYIAFMDILCLRADSALLMIVFVFALLLYFALDKKEWLSRYIVVVQIFAAANITVYLLKLALQDHMYDFDGLNALFLKTGVVVFEILVCAVLYGVQKKFVSRLSKERMPRLQKVYGIAFLAAAGIGILAVLLLNVMFSEAASGTPLGYVILNDTTGNGRGYAWIRTVELFFKQPFLSKLFGCGLGCFYDFIYPTYGAEMLERFNSVFYDPHNDFLQVLATTGIVGAIGFFGAIFATICAAVKKRKNREMQIMAVLSLAAFLVQGLVNSYTIFAIPLVFVVLALACVPSKAEK